MSFCIALCIDVWQDSLIGKERMSRPVGGNKMSVLNLEDVIVEVATELALAGECDVPVDNKWNGVDLVAPGHYEFQAEYRRTHYLGLRDGVRISIEDNTVHVFKFEKGGVSAHATFAAGFGTLNSILVAVVKEWI